MIFRTMFESRLPGIPLLKRGKTRDVYDLGDELLIVATDRLSCFDVVLPTAIPGKGEVLTALSQFWFEKTADIIPNHLVGKPSRTVEGLLRIYMDRLAGRFLIARRARPIPFECIVRGYLAGSALKEYTASGTVCGRRLPAGLVPSSPLPEPLFTPSTKADQGHDENVSVNHLRTSLGRPLADQLEALSLALYQRAHVFARERGVIIADTKFEFGMVGDELVLIDEALTPDSSRFWPLAGYTPGKRQPSFDKQFVRDYLETVSWDKKPPGPNLPGDIVARTAEKYCDARRLLTGTASA